MSILMSGLTTEKVALCTDDFPWRSKTSHPLDFLESPEPMEPELIFHHVRGRHNRLWLRVSWQLGENKFMPMSFLLDTGAPKHFYMCNQAMTALEAAGLTGVDEDTDVEWTTIFGRKCLVELTPEQHQPANIIGLKMLKRLGLQLFEEEPHFAFSVPFKFFTANKTQ